MIGRKTTKLDAATEPPETSDLYSVGIHVQPCWLVPTLDALVVAMHQRIRESLTQGEFRNLKVVAVQAPLQRTFWQCAIFTFAVGEVSV